jgi:hypothetical protein
LHFVSDDDDPSAIIAAIRDALPSGSYLVLSHVTGDVRRESAARAAVHYKKVTYGATLRGQEEIFRFFAGPELIELRVVQVPDWRSDGPEPADAGKVWILGGVGHKPCPPPAGRLWSTTTVPSWLTPSEGRHGTRISHWRSRVHRFAPDC